MYICIYASTYSDMLYVISMSIHVAISMPLRIPVFASYPSETSSSFVHTYVFIFGAVLVFTRKPVCVVIPMFVSFSMFASESLFIPASIVMRACGCLFRLFLMYDELFTFEF